MKQLRRIHALMAFFCVLSFYAAAQKARFDFFSNANGLEGNNTATVTQDDQGFLWLVNDGKLHRYDGRTFLIYSLPPELSVNQEPIIGVSSWQDSLLFVWSEQFAFLFDPKTGNWEVIKFKEGSSLKDGALFWQRLGEKNILISSVKAGYKHADIWRFQNKQLAPVQFPKHISTLQAAYFWCDVDANGHTYLAYQDTLYQLDPSGSEITKTTLDNICRNCYDLCFRFMEDGTLVLLAGWQFYILDRASNRFMPHPANRFLKAGSNHLHRFIIEKNGSIWGCGQDRNLIYYDAAGDTLYNYNTELKALLPNSNDFKGLYQDKTGIVWIDTRLGLLKVRPQTYPFYTYFNELNQSRAYYSFRGFTEDAQGMMYGVYYNGIAQFDPNKKQSQRLYTFKSLLSFFDLYTLDNVIWVNSGQFFDPRSGNLKNVPSLFHESYVGDNGFFAQDKNGTLWWASHYMLYCLEYSENGYKWIKALELPEKIFNKTDALYAGKYSGKLWISFKGKLLQYDPATQEQRWFNPETWGIPRARIMAIEEDPFGKLWLATDDGLVHVNPAEATFEQFNVSDGLPNAFVCGLLSEGDSCLWLSTNHGLSRFHIPTKTFINFFEEDGLTANEFNRKSYFKSRDGRFFFGGMRGVNAFYPEVVMKAYRNKEKGAHIVLTSFEYTDERRDSILRETKFTTSPEIHLHYWDWSYTFEYALTDYNNPEEILYSYKMEGYKDGWSAPSKFNFTRFNSLPSGTYTFRVKARDSHGRWHPDELAVKVVVYPPFWATWWAYLVYLLLAFGISYAIYSFLKKRLLLQNQLKLEHEESIRLKELDGFKSRLYTNLTHEFRTPLTVILGMVGQIRDQPKKYLEEGTRLIETNGKNLLHLINQLLDLSKLENKSFQLHLQQSDVIPYLRYITESFQTYANGKNLSLRFFSNLESLVMDYDPEQIKQVLTNLLSNAIKFTPSGGEVSVRVKFDADHKMLTTSQNGFVDHWLNIAIKDTGIGIAEKDLAHVFDRFYQVDGSHTRQGEGTGIGLAHTQELVKLMGGEVHVESVVNKGSVFFVTLPVTRKAPEIAGVPAFDNWVGLPESKSEVESYISQSTNPPSTCPQLLIIEDNPDVVAYLKSCLEEMYQVDVAFNGKIGIEKALENIPDLIISDVMMPEKDGYQVCDTLKNDDRTSHIPIILLTAKADAASKIAGLKRGADAYLTKPFDKEELLVRLEMLVKRQKRMAAYFSHNLLKETAPLPNDTEEAIQIEDVFMQKVRQIVEEHYSDEHFALPELCKKIGMSRSQLFRKMQAISEISPSDFIRSYRLNKAKDLLESTSLTVSEVAWRVGYKDIAHFSKSYLDAFGTSPRHVRK